VRAADARPPAEAATTLPAPPQAIDATASAQSLANRLEPQGLTGLIVEVCL
jgi:hypothetical protein